MSRVRTFRGVRTFLRDPGAVLYSISADRQFIKFGFASRPKARLIELQVGSPLKLELLATIDALDQSNAARLESLIHTAAIRYHVRGEWFKSCPKTLAIVAAMKGDLESFEKCIYPWAHVENARAKDSVNSQVISNLKYSASLG